MRQLSFLLFSVMKRTWNALFPFGTKCVMVENSVKESISRKEIDMKKKLVVLFVCAVTAMATLSGCGKGSAFLENESSVSSEAESGTVITAKELLAATDYSISDYVTLMEDYDKIPVTLENDYTVTDEMIETFANVQLLSSLSDYKETEKQVVEDGDIANIDYEGKKDGVAFDGGTAQGYNLEIGSGTFIPGFEDALIGMKVGETRDIDLTFPEDYKSEELAGQDVVFTVTVNSIMEAVDVEYSTLTDEFVASNFAMYGASTKDDLTALVRQTLESQYNQAKQQEIRDQQLAALKEGCKVTIPEGLKEARIQEVYDSVKKEAESNEKEYEEYVTDTYAYESLDAFEKEVEETIAENLVTELILEALVEAMDISVNSNDVAEYVNYYVTNGGYESEDAFYESYGGKANVQLTYAENQAMRTLIENANITNK